MNLKKVDLGVWVNSHLTFSHLKLLLYNGNELLFVTSCKFFQNLMEPLFIVYRLISSQAAKAEAIATSPIKVAPKITIALPSIRAAFG
ncbi:hypothetical protein Ple7327_2223 [Pleurocapsa sp. PCC 7327]|nr:hypothetical protein Ple7327_2223 [Pleurocapsa sp. PCC 7327]